MIEIDTRPEKELVRERLAKGIADLEGTDGWHDLPRDQQWERYSLRLRDAEDEARVLSHEQQGTGITVVDFGLGVGREVRYQAERVWEAMPNPRTQLGEAARRGLANAWWALSSAGALYEDVTEGFRNRIARRVDTSNVVQLPRGRGNR